MVCVEFSPCLIHGLCAIFAIHGVWAFFRPLSTPVLAAPSWPAFQFTVCTSRFTRLRTKWGVPNLVVSNLDIVCNFYAEALFCALLRSFALFCGLAFAMFCAHLRSFARICVFLRPNAFRTTALGNCRQDAVAVSVCTTSGNEKGKSDPDWAMLLEFVFRDRHNLLEPFSRAPKPTPNPEIPQKKTASLHELFRKNRANVCLLRCDTS